MRWLAWVVLLLMLDGCVSKIADTQLVAFSPIKAFSGRLLVMNPRHRWQFEVDWQGDEKQGALRLTHASTGRIVDVKWLDQTMLLRDATQSVTWQPLSPPALHDMGIILPPWALARVFLGTLPASMQPKDHRTWQGRWGDADLRIRWSSQQQRVELLDMKQGRRIVLLFDEVRH